MTRIEVGGEGRLIGLVEPAPGIKVGDRKVHRAVRLGEAAKHAGGHRVGPRVALVMGMEEEHPGRDHLFRVGSRKRDEKRRKAG